MFTSTSTLIEHAVQLGARRPTTGVVIDPERWANWRAAADQLVVGSTIIDLRPDELADLIEACDRAAGWTPERIGEAINTAGAGAIVAAVALLIIML